MNYSPSTIKPYKPQSCIISSKLAYQIFLKNHPKFIKTLDVKRTIDLSSGFFSNRLRCKKDYLIEIAKRSKGCKALRVQQYEGLCYFKLSVHREIIKKFKYIEQLSLGEVSEDVASIIKFYSRWLLECKCITSIQLDLTCGSMFYLRSTINEKGYFGTTGNKKDDYRFFKLLKNKKLKAIELEKPLGIIVFPFPTYPTSLSKLCIADRKSQNFLSNNEVLQALTSRKLFLTHLQNLSSFKMFLALAPFVISSILSSILNPEKITCLCLNIDTNCSSDLVDPKVLTTFTSLQELTLKFCQPFSVVETLQAFNIKNLTTLDLVLPLQDEKESLDFANFVGKIENLQVLRTKINSGAKSNVLTSFKAYFENVSKLENLHVLEINFNGVEIKSESLLTDLSDCLGRLPDLKEFGLNLYKTGCSPAEFNHFMKTLKNKASQLLKVSLNFGNFAMKLPQILAIVEALQEMKLLEVLIMKNINIDDEKPVERILASSKFLSRLKILDLHLNSLGISRELFLLALEEIISRRGLETFTCKGRLTLKDKTPWTRKIDVKEVMKKNQKLMKIDINPELKGCMESLNLLNQCQW